MCFIRNIVTFEIWLKNELENTPLNFVNCFSMIRSMSLLHNSSNLVLFLGPPPVDYYSLPDAKYPPPYPLMDVTPVIVNQPTAPKLDLEEV